MLPARLAAAALVASLVIGGGACGGCGEDGPGQPAAEPPSPYAACGEEAARQPLEEAVCAAWRQGGEHGATVARHDAREHVTNKTRDGYRLRSWVSLLLVGLGLWITGTILGALLVTWSRRRRGVRFGDHVAGLITAEGDAVRALGRDADPLVRQLVDRVRAPLAELERQARALATRCQPLEQGGDKATAKAHLEGLYRQLDALAARVERLHVQVTLWREKVATSDSQELEGELDEALRDLEAAMAATGEVA
jgi:hypothetical protein